MEGHNRVETSFDRIVASLHEAMLDETRWQEASILIDEACGLTGSHLVVFGGHDNDAVWLFDKAYWRGELREDLARDYALNYFPRDERIPSLLALPDRRVAPVADLYTDRELSTSPTYNELLARADARNGLNMRMDGPNGLHIVWALANPTQPDGWNSRQIKLIEHVLPHIRQFVRVRNALAGAEALNASLADLLDNTLAGVICLDWRGKIVQTNDRARAILRGGDGLADRDGFLRARHAKDDVTLGTLLARVLPRTGGEAVTGGSIRVARPAGLPQYALHAIPVAAHRAGFGVGRIAALVLIVEPGVKPAIRPEIVAATLGLSRAESEVAAALAEGLTVPDIARTTYRAESTVRWQIKRIHAKLGLSRQADLVRIVLSLANPAPRR